MRALAIAVLLACSTTAHAETVLEIGAGAPAGVTFGLGGRVAGWQGVIEVGGATAGMAGMLSASAQLHVDIQGWRTAVLAVGVSLTHLGWMAAGDEMVTGTVDTAGPTLQLRIKASHRTQLVLEAGAGPARCRGDCDSDVFVMPLLTGRLVVDL